MTHVTLPSQNFSERLFQGENGMKEKGGGNKSEKGKGRSGRGRKGRGREWGWREGKERKGEGKRIGMRLFSVCDIKSLVCLMHDIHDIHDGLTICSHNLEFTVNSSNSLLHDHGESQMFQIISCLPSCITNACFTPCCINQSG